MEKQALKKQFDEKFKELENFIKSQDLDPRSKSVAITNLQTSKMWAVRGLFEKSK